MHVESKTCDAYNVYIEFEGNPMPLQCEKQKYMKMVAMVQCSTADQTTSSLKGCTHPTVRSHQVSLQDFSFVEFLLSEHITVIPMLCEPLNQRTHRKTIKNCSQNPSIYVPTPPFSLSHAPVCVCGLEVNITSLTPSS